MLIWREIFWISIKDKLADACSNLIKSYRLNQAVKIDLIHDIIESYSKKNMLFV